MAVIKGNPADLTAALSKAKIPAISPLNQKSSKLGLGDPSTFLSNLSKQTPLDALNANIGVSNPDVDTSFLYPSKTSTSEVAPSQKSITPVAQKSVTQQSTTRTTTQQPAATTKQPVETKLDASNSFTVVNSAGQQTVIPADKLFDYQNNGWKLAETSTQQPATGTATTTQQPTATTATPDASTRITSLLNQGYSTPENIAIASGLSVDEVNNFLSSDTNASYMLKTNQVTNQADEAYQNYIAKVDAITNGTFALTADEQADIQQIKDTFARLREAQVTANKNYEGAVATGEIRSGREEFMNQISAGIQKQAIDDGVQKVADIESQALSKIREYKNAIADKNYKAAAASYEAITKYLDQKSIAIKELHNSTVAMYKAQQESITNALNNAKLKQEVAKNTIEGLTPALLGADESVIADVAAYYGIDENLLTGNIKSTIQKTDADMASKGYRTISPADAGKMRANGADVITINGRTYAKEPEIKSVTNKGNIDFFKGTQKIASVPLTGGGPASGPSSEEKEIAAMQKDVSEIQNKYATQDISKESARKLLWSKYGASATRPGGLTNETISILIPD